MTKPALHSNDPQQRTPSANRGRSNPHSLPGRSAPSRLQSGGAVERRKDDEIWSSPIKSVHPRLLRSRSDSGGEWLEVVYDLVYAVAFSELCTTVADHATWRGIMRLSLLLVPFWWSWSGYNAFMTRFDADDLGQRLLTFAQMFGLIIMVASASAAQNHAPGALFAAGYCLSRGSMLLMYVRTRAVVPPARKIIDFYLWGFSVGIACWIASIWVPGVAKYILWAVGLATDMAVPWFGRATLKRFPLNPSRVQDRLSILISIVIGAALEFIITGMKDAALKPMGLLNGALAFCYTLASWWLYIGFIKNPRIKNVVSSGQSIVYSHLPLVLGLLLMSSGLFRAVREAAGGVPERELTATVLMVGGGTALWLLSISMIQSAVLEMFLRRPMMVTFSGAVALILLTTVGLHAPLWLAMLAGFIVLCATIYARARTNHHRTLPG